MRSKLLVQRGAKTVLIASPDAATAAERKFMSDNMRDKKTNSQPAVGSPRKAGGTAGGEAQTGRAPGIIRRDIGRASHTEAAGSSVSQNVGGIATPASRPGLDK
jgi:hypothetical protein